MTRFKPSAAVVGTGQTRIGRLEGRTALDLMADATAAALDNAGLERAAIDGLITMPSLTEGWMMPAAVVCRGLGISPKYLNTSDLAGATGAAMVDQAAHAIASGACETVLCVAGDPLLSGLSRDRAVALMANTAAHGESEAHIGMPVPALYALVATRYMHEYGATREQLSAAAVQMRSHAQLNPDAHFTAPITTADVTASKLIATPFHMLDCAPVSDGAAALIVVSAERAKRMNRRAAYLLGSGYGLSHAYLSDAQDLLVTGARQSGATAYAIAGVGPTDMQFGCLYDCFTVTPLLELEDLNLCPRGQAGAFFADGHADRTGRFPVNPSGGLLSGGHPGLPAGLFPVIEAVRQVKGDAGARQLPRTDVGIAHGNGGVIGMHCTLIFGATHA